MPLSLRESSATLSGVIAVDDVEKLVAWLRATPKGRVNLRNCTHMHTGAFQALWLFRPKISVAPADPFLATQVHPLLDQDRGPEDRPGSEGTP